MHEEVHNFCFSPAMHGEMRNAHKNSVGKPKGKRLLGRRRHRWEDNTKLDLKEISMEGVVQDKYQW